MNVTAAIDTNVMIDVLSAHDSTSLYARRVGEGVDAAVVLGSSDARYRRARARAALILAVHLHRERAVTVSLWEVFELLKARVDVHAATPDRNHLTLAIHFVKAIVLSDWTLAADAELDGALRGNAADDALVRLAAQNGYPVVTNEGVTPAGVVDEGLRKKAREAGIAVFAPHEFYDGKIDEAEAIEWFLGRFGDLAPTFAEANGNPSAAMEALLWMHAYYRHVLLGETKTGLIVAVR